MYPDFTVKRGYILERVYKPVARKQRNSLALYAPAFLNLLAQSELLKLCNLIEKDGTAYHAWVFELSSMTCVKGTEALRDTAFEAALQCLGSASAFIDRQRSGALNYYTRNAASIWDTPPTTWVY